MLTWYKTIPGTVFWQVLNQSFNATVNYTNRSGDKPIPTSQLGISFGIATTSATATAIFLGQVARKMPPIVGRFVPFAAVAAANCINLPFMRSSEVTEGIQLVNANDEKVAQSPKVAKKAIAQVNFVAPIPSIQFDAKIIFFLKVVMSRIFMATPGMILVN